ncbi:MAG: DUF3604 domain-containing protein [Vicinamibacterales bacterium]|jgi:hypothetical protein|nr:DUF3604 domain-containing protein [Vicinamibacterales bacterium]MDP7478508.1 DUF3604 domain-containing protein [Vicinamibacterales bacterium]MDP7690724.1 DUF3604 domain-containing protein [Vicinamibacterales bacterium]HJN45112.1 DUF3604 domain-containing protein [Vicinamibacterales bacterium]
MRLNRELLVPGVIALLAIAPMASAQDVPVTPENASAPDRPYSPYAGRNFPTRVFWGDTHLHTSNSLDARAVGATLGPEDAFRFARGDEVISSHGERVRLSRPLDWLVVSDHSDAMGAMNEIVAGNPDLMRNATLRDWHERIIQG